MTAKVYALHTYAPEKRKFEIATSIVEVREGRVTNYNGKYDDYVYRVNKEIEAGEREAAVGRVKAPPEVLKAGKSAKAAPTIARRGADELRKELKQTEQAIAALDEQRRVLDARLCEPTEPDELQHLCDQLAEIATEHDEAEAKWLELQSELESVE